MDDLLPAAAAVVEEQSSDQAAKRPKIDVRMKRHPELQPYKPFDRCFPVAPGGRLVSRSTGSTQSKLRVVTRPDEIVAGRVRNIQTVSKIKPESNPSKLRRSASSLTARSLNDRRNQPNDYVNTNRPLERYLRPHTQSIDDSNSRTVSNDSIVLMKEPDIRSYEEEDIELRVESSSNVSETTENSQDVPALGRLGPSRPSAASGLSDLVRRLDQLKETKNSLGFDEDLSEMVRREEEERRKRQMLIDSILSKFNQKTTQSV